MFGDTLVGAAWLMLAVGDERQHGGNEGYDDDPETHYSWDSTVPNHDRPRRGDVIALWDKKFLLGASVIESIDESDAVKRRNRCPSCRMTGIKARKRNRPRYRCHNRTCLHEFDDPLLEDVEVHTYRSDHSVAWVDLGGVLEGAELRRLCVPPGSMHSIRALDANRFKTRVGARGKLASLGVVEQRRKRLSGGHSTATVRVRKGQGGFRSTLLERFGYTCAFTGKQPAESLEAAHLYSYADLGTHDEFGGLILRRDIHRLFDVGLLAVNPRTQAIDVHPQLMDYPSYSRLHGTSIHVDLDRKTGSWLRDHWAQHRVAVSAVAAGQ
jgi:hypothetical protein